MKNTKLCPFKKTFRRSVKKGRYGEFVNEHEERFAPCLGMRCMAYSSGGCLKISKEERK